MTNEQKAGQRTFRELDGNLDLGTPVWALEQWYEDARDTPLEKIGLLDLARACRQHTFVEEILPYCLAHLEAHPLAGELYDGELVLALKDLGGGFWQARPRERKQFLALARRAYEKCFEYELEGEPEQSTTHELFFTEEELLAK